ncbi:MAG: glycosyltransferase family 39 protein [Methanobacteriaceae archaeon]|nr:glycosyltransferase family 39 protein [Methanobacteriaceae archaeon]
MISFRKIYNKMEKRPFWAYSIILIAFAIIFTIYLLEVQIRIGVIYWDVYLYLNNALMFAGLGEGYKIYLSPLIPFLTSLLYRAGFVFQSSLYLVTGLIFILGIYGMYLLLNLRFTHLKSFAGAIIFTSCSVLLPWAVSGALDVPAVCFSIWTIFLAVYGLEKNNKAIYFIFPAAALAFLTRYTSGLLILPLLFLFITHYFDKGFTKSEIKKIAISIVLGILIFLPFVGFFYANLGNPFPFLDQFGVSVENHASTRDPGLMPDKAYYLKNIPNYISSYPLNDSRLDFGSMMTPNTGQVNPISYLFLFLTGLGLISYVSGILNKLWAFLKNNCLDSVTKKNTSSGRNINKKLDSWFNNRYILPIMVFLVEILIILFIISLGGNSYLISELLMFSTILITYFALRKIEIIKGREIKKVFRIDLIILIWFLTYLISHSFLSIKVDRYFITMIPAVVYFMVLGLSNTGNLIARLTNKLDHKKIISGAIIIILAVTLFASALQPYEDKVPYKVYGFLEEGAKMMKTYDPHYKEQVIFSDQWPALSWYLKMDVQRGYPLDFKTSAEFSQMLKNSNATYFISTNGRGSLNMEGYSKVANDKIVYIYKRNLV